MVDQGASPGLGLRPVGPDDLELLEAMVRAYYREDGHQFDPDRQRRALRAMADGDPWVRAWIVELGPRDVGYAVVTQSFSVESGGRDGFIDEVWLEPEVRGRGLGCRLLAMIEGEARALGLNRLYLEVEHHNRAIRLYRRAGFLEHRRYLMSMVL